MQRMRRYRMHVTRALYVTKIALQTLHDGTACPHAITEPRASNRRPWPVRSRQHQPQHIVVEASRGLHMELCVRAQHVCA